jgi:ribonuclease G
MVVGMIRDLLADDIDKIWMDNEKEYRRLVRHLRQVSPDLAGRTQQFREKTPIFEKYNIENEIEKTLERKVWLKKGGYLVVNQTEALVAIDVNTGKFVGSTSLEETAFAINLEAVREIVRQLRLRHLGGIIVIDFIDMLSAAHREAVYRTLEEELASDPARTQLLPMSDIGLVQLTRKRTRPSLERTLSRECPYCHGSGRIKSLPTICLEIRRRLLDTAEVETGDQISLTVHPEVSHYLQGPFRELLRELEEVHGLQVILRENPVFHQEQYEITR